MISATNSLARLQSQIAEEPEQASERAAREFESLVLSQMMKTGTKPLFEDSLLDGGSAGRMAREQLLTQLVAEVAAGRGLGLVAQLEGGMTEPGSPAESDGSEPAKGPEPTHE